MPCRGGERHIMKQERGSWRPLLKQSMMVENVEKSLDCLRELCVCVCVCVCVITCMLDGRRNACSNARSNACLMRMTDPKLFCHTHQKWVTQTHTHKQSMMVDNVEKSLKMATFVGLGLSTCSPRFDPRLRRQKEKARTRSARSPSPVRGCIAPVV